MDKDEQILLMQHYLDICYPLIEAARLLRARYTGNLDGVPDDALHMRGFDGVPKVAPDQAGAVIDALNNIERQITITPDDGGSDAD